MSSVVRVRTVLVLTLALLAVAGALVTGSRLQGRANAARDAELELTALRMNLALAEGIPWDASPSGSDDVELVRDELERAEGVIYRALDRLGRDSAEVRAIQKPVDRGSDALWRTLEAVAVGDDEEASRQSTRSAHALAVADDALLAAAAHHREDSKGALGQARLQWIAVIAALFGAFAWFYVRVARERRIAERFADENRELLAAARREALTDALTGLGNRRALIAALDAARPGGGGARLVLALFDLNGFKQYNDRYGHPAGDALLTRLGDRLAATMDGIGSAYRMGGDEFCIVAQVPDGDEASLAALAAGALAEQGESFTIDCAYGIAVMPDDTCAPNVALSLADQRMYEQKAAREPGFVAVQMVNSSPANRQPAMPPATR